MTRPDDLDMGDWKPGDMEFLKDKSQPTAPVPAVVVDPETGAVTCRKAPYEDVLDAVQAWNDTRVPVGLPDVVDALTPSPDEAVLIVAAALADPPPEGLAARAEAAVQEAARESVWADPPWSGS